MLNLLVVQDDNADAKKIVTAFPPEDWKNYLGRTGQPPSDHMDEDSPK